MCKVKKHMYQNKKIKVKKHIYTLFKNWNQLENLVSDAKRIDCGSVFEVLDNNIFGLRW
jgi:uncharacterized membrane protein